MTSPGKILRLRYSRIGCVIVFPYSNERDPIKLNETAQRLKCRDIEDRLIFGIMVHQNTDLLATDIIPEAVVNLIIHPSFRQFQVGRSKLMPVEGRGPDLRVGCRSNLQVLFARICRKSSTSLQKLLIINTVWRRERDSNPRCPFRHNGFQDRRIKPLCHPSAGVDISSIVRPNANWSKSAFGFAILRS
jgi:hypothetical protein